jgi:hypothetical protein
MRVLKTAITLIVSGALVTSQMGLAAAAPLPTNVETIKAMVPERSTQVYWRGGWGWGVGAGLLAGALIGGAIAGGPYGYYDAPYYYGHPYPYYGYYQPRAVYYGYPSYYGYQSYGYYRPYGVYRYNRWHHYHW